MRNSHVRSVTDYSVLVSLCLLAASACRAQPEVTRQSSPQQTMDLGPTYSYQLDINSQIDLCTHMSIVFNEAFRDVWDKELFTQDDERNYSATSKYAFPTMSGVEHDDMTTAQMSYSKQPTSPEFDAINWLELRVVLGAPPGVQMPSSMVSLPALLAYYDFDNDGDTDTVLKHGFTEGYRRIRNAAPEESLSVWRSTIVPIPAGSSLWVLRNESPWSEELVSWSGTYFRPFKYDGHSYVALYEMALSDLGARSEGPFTIAGETMSVLDFRHTGQRSELTLVPVWTTTELCRYQMM